MCTNQNLCWPYQIEVSDQHSVKFPEWLHGSGLFSAIRPVGVAVSMLLAIMLFRIGNSLYAAHVVPA